MKAGTLASCLSCLLLACGGRANGQRSDASAARDAGASSADANVSTDVDTGASADANDGEASCASTQQSSVWIGQADTTVTFPYGDYDGGDPIQVACPGCLSEFLYGLTPLPDSPPEKVVLILNPITDSVTGTITFGEDRPPPPPTDPKKLYPPPTRWEYPDGAIGTFNLPWGSSFPYPGFSYSLVSSYMIGKILHLAFVPSEVWRDSCALQDGGSPPYHPGGPNPGQCDCEGGVCRAAVSSIDRIDLVVDCDTMQGQLLWGGADVSSTPIAIRLQRVH